MMAKKSKVEAPGFFRHITARGIERCSGPMEPQTETCKTKRRSLSFSRPLSFCRLVHEAPSLLWAPRANGRKENRSDELLRGLRYEHAPVYEALAQHKRACSELEKLYAEAPDYEDVPGRLVL